MLNLLIAAMEIIHFFQLLISSKFYPKFNFPLSEFHFYACKIITTNVYTEYHTVLHMYIPRWIYQILVNQHALNILNSQYNESKSAYHFQYSYHKN